MLEVKEAKYLGGYKVELLFNNGERLVVDLRDELDGPAFEPLKDLAVFKQFKINFNTIEWPNGADFAPEYLYGLATGKYLKVAEEKTHYLRNKKDRNPFRFWLFARKIPYLKSVRNTLSHSLEVKPKPASGLR